MNKTVISLLLLGLVVAAVATEFSKDKLEKMRLQKAKAMAKKERTGMDKLRNEKMRELAARKDAMHGADVDNVRQKFLELKEELKSGQLTYEEYGRKAVLLKDQFGGSRATREKAAKKPLPRSRRETKEAMKQKAFDLKEDMRKKKSAYKNKQNKIRRGQ